MKYYCDNMRHIVCEPYSIEGLHEMAEDLDLKRCWFHNSKYPHYDIPKRRIKEIEDKCIIVSPKVILSICKTVNIDVMKSNEQLLAEWSSVLTNQNLAPKVIESKPETIK